MNEKRITGCPSCKGQVVITEYECPSCGITVRGRFLPSGFAELNSEQMNFVAAFLASHGNIRQMEARLGISYPTVKSRLKEINQILGIEESTEVDKTSNVLDLLEKGEIDVSEAIKKLEKER